MSETLVALSAPAARALTDRIKTGVEVVWELITQAYTERAWDALGYSSWDDYCTREFGTSRLRLPREERSEVVASLRESGLSIRAIAAATGDNKNTIQRELSGVPNGTPDPVTGTDGKTYQPKPRPVVDPQPEPEAPPKPRRRPITDQARDLGWELRKAAEKLERLYADDRYSDNKKQVDQSISAHLQFASDAIAMALGSIDQ